MIKIDVEGTESRVLEGMRQTLRSKRPVVVVEVHAGQEAQVPRLLGELEYDVSALLDDAGGMPHLLALPRPDLDSPASLREP